MSRPFKGNSITKTKHLAKVLSKIENSEKNISRGTSINDSKYFSLPPIEKSVYLKAVSEPTSVLTRYLLNHTHNFLRYTEDEIKRPIKIVPDSRSRRNKNKGEEGENEDIGLKDEKRKKNGINCITERGTKESKIFDKYNRKAFYLTETKDIKDNSPPQKLTLSKDSSSKTNIIVKQETLDEDLFFQKSRNNIPDAISAEQEFTIEKIRRFGKYFHRLKSYQPKIFTDWKYIN